MTAAARHTCLLLAVAVVLVFAQEDDADWQGSPGWAPAVAEDLQLAATVDTSKPPKTCRPEIISMIDFGVATAAYQVRREHTDL
jgi:hypothetical protein